MNKLISDIVNTLKSILPDFTSIALHEPFFLGNEKKYINDCIDSRFVSSIGPYVTQFEAMLAAFTGSEHAVATVNGTSALHTALLLAGVKENDEVLVPALTFVATANAVVYCHAVPHFIDSDKATLGVDVYKLAEYLEKNTVIKKNVCINKNTRRPVKAVIPVHVFGIPVDMDPLIEICNAYHLALVEDAAEGLGSGYKETHVGNFGLFGTISFNGNKTITTGGGGAILCNDRELARQAKHMTTTARIQDNLIFSHDRTGFNYRMPNINAALGCAQLEQLPEILKKKRQLAQLYIDAFDSMKGVHMIQEPDFAKTNFWLNGLVLDEPDADLLQMLLEKTNKKGIQTRPLWALLDSLPMFSGNPKMDLSTARELVQQVISLPSSINLVE